MNKSRILIAIVLSLAVFGGLFLINNNWRKNTANQQVRESNQADEGGFSEKTLPALSISGLRELKYPGSEVTLVQTLDPGSNYQRYIASYKSEGLKIFALLTVPNGDPPKAGWPAIIFNHGFIPPLEYRTTEKYIVYTDGFSKNGYLVFKSDYRGHGNSEGTPIGAYGGDAYTIDVLNALASIKNYPGVDKERIGMWGHSLGGFVTLRSMVVARDIKAGVIWSGVVGSYPDLFNRWRRSSASPFPLPTGFRRWRQALVEQYGTPERNPEFWASISANSYLSDISGPLQLHHGLADSSVPSEFSEKLFEQLQKTGKTAELYTYPGDDHNLSQNFTIAMERSVKFFDKYLKSSITR